MALHTRLILKVIKVPAHALTLIHLQHPKLTGITTNTLVLAHCASLTAINAFPTNKLRILLEKFIHANTLIGRCGLKFPFLYYSIARVALTNQTPDLTS